MGEGGPFARAVQDLFSSSCISADQPGRTRPGLGRRILPVAGLVLKMVYHQPVPFSAPAQPPAEWHSRPHSFAQVLKALFTGLARRPALDPHHHVHSRAGRDWQTPSRRETEAAIWAVGSLTVEVTVDLRPSRTGYKRDLRSMAKKGLELRAQTGLLHPLTFGGIA